MTDFRRERQSYARRQEETRRWEDYVERDVRKAGDEEDWKTIRS